MFKRTIVAVLASFSLAVPAVAQEAAVAPAPTVDDEEGVEAIDPTEAPAMPSTGAVSVSSSPAGRVYIDGADTGLDTPLVDHPVAPGTHTLKVVEEATGRAKEVTFRLDAGGILNLNLNLPEAAAATDKPAEMAASSQPAGETGEEPAAVATVAEEVDDWSWMTVAGWASLGVGTLGLLAGAVILTTPTDPNQGPLGFGLFGLGAGLVLGGGVLLYLDSELADSQADDKKPEGEGGDAEEKSARLPGNTSLAFSE